MTAQSSAKFSPNSVLLAIAQSFPQGVEVVEYERGEVMFSNLSRTDLLRFLKAFKFSSTTVTSTFVGNKLDYAPTESDVDQISVFVVDVFINSAHANLTIQTEKMDDTYHLTIIPDLDLDSATLYTYLLALSQTL